MTEDSDFGDLIFRLGLPHPCLVRLVGMTPAERAGAMRTLIEQHAQDMRDGAVIVVSRKRVRIRSAANIRRSLN